MTRHAEGCCCYLDEEGLAKLAGYPPCDRSCPECECCEATATVRIPQPIQVPVLAAH